MANATIRKPRPKYLSLTALLFEIRLPLPGWVSILHRVSGAMLFLALPLLLWLFDLSLISEDSFARMASVGSNVFLKLVLLLLIWSFFHHLVAGIRYLLLDLHVGVEKSAARSSALAVFWISLPLTLLAALKLFGVF